MLFIFRVSQFIVNSFVHYPMIGCINNHVTLNTSLLTVLFFVASKPILSQSEKTNINNRIDKRPLIDVFLLEPTVSTTTLLFIFQLRNQQIKNFAELVNWDCTCFSTCLSVCNMMTERGCAILRRILYECAAK